jgi:hypothetical protein
MHVVLCIYMPPHLIVAASIWRATRLQVTDTSHACCFVHLHATRPHCGCFNLATRATRLQVTDTSHACCFVHLHATRPHCGCFNLACNTITGDRHKPCIYMPPHLIVAASIWRATRLQVTDTSHACCFVHLHATTPHCGCFNLGCNTITGDRHKPCMLCFNLQHDADTSHLHADTSHACFVLHVIVAILHADQDAIMSLWLLQSGVQHDQVTDTSHACFVHLHATTPHCGCFNLACNTITGDRHKPCMLFCAFDRHKPCVLFCAFTCHHPHCGCFNLACNTITGDRHKPCHLHATTSLWLLQSGVQHDYR